LLVALIVAAGSSSRMQGVANKIKAPLIDRPLIVHTLAPFMQEGSVAAITLVVAAREVADMRRIVAESGTGKAVTVIAGGATRQESVCLGLASLPPECDLVAIHDGARPCLSDASLAAVIAAARRTGAALLAVPVKDTVKRVRCGGEVDTPERGELFLAQTPQVFRRDWIEVAHAQAREHGLQTTDDAALVTACGHQVTVVPGDYRNIKVTTPEDLPLAELFLRMR